MTERRERQHQGGFAGRLREVVEAYGTASALAGHIERSEGAVRKWLRGESEPNVTDLRSLCAATGTRPEWLVTGEGERQVVTLSVQETPARYGPCGGLSHALLAQILEAVEDELARTAVSLSPAKRAKLVATLYGLYQDRGEVGRDVVAHLVQLAR